MSGDACQQLAEGCRLGELTGQFAQAPGADVDNDQAEEEGLEFYQIRFSSNHP